MSNYTDPGRNYFGFVAEKYLLPLTEDLATALKREVETTGKTKAHIVRTALAEYFANHNQ